MLFWLNDGMEPIGYIRVNELYRAELKFVFPIPLPFKDQY